MSQKFTEFPVSFSLEFNDDSNKQNVSSETQVDYLVAPTIEELQQAAKKHLENKNVEYNITTLKDNEGCEYGSDDDVQGWFDTYQNQTLGIKIVINKTDNKPIISADIKQNDDISIVATEPMSQIKSWSEFPNLLQVLAINCDAIKIIFTLKNVMLEITNYTIKNVSKNNEIMTKITIEKNSNVVTKDINAEPNKMYNLAVFSGEIKISNTVNIQTHTQNFVVNNNYIPYSPLKNDIKLFHDETKENILMIWNVPMLTFGDSIIYKIKLSNQLKFDQVIRLPYKILKSSISSIAAFKINISTISVFDKWNKKCESKQSESLYINIGNNDIIEKHYNYSPLQSVTIQFMNSINPTTAVSTIVIDNISFDALKRKIINIFNIKVDQQYVNSLQFKAKINDKYKDINKSTLSDFVSNDLSKNIGIIIFCYFLPKQTPVLSSSTVENDSLICQYDLFVPFEFEYKIRMKSFGGNNIISNKTKYATNTIIIKNISTICQHQFSIQARCVMFENKSNWSKWSQVIYPNKTNSVSVNKLKTQKHPKQTTKTRVRKRARSDSWIKVKQKSTFQKKPVQYKRGKINANLFVDKMKKQQNEKNKIIKKQQKIRKINVKMTTNKMKSDLNAKWKKIRQEQNTNKDEILKNINNLNADKIVDQITKQQKENSQIVQEKKKINKVNVEEIVNEMKSDLNIKLKKVRDMKNKNKENVLKNVESLNTEQIVSEMAQKQQKQIKINKTTQTIKRMDVESKVNEMKCELDEKLESTRDMQNQNKDAILKNIKNLNADQIASTMEQNMDIAHKSQVNENKIKLKVTSKKLDADSIVENLNQQNDEKTDEIMKNNKYLNDSINKIDIEKTIDEIKCESNKKWEEIRDINNKSKDEILKNVSKLTNRVSEVFDKINKMNKPRKRKSIFSNINKLDAYSMVLEMKEQESLIYQQRLVEHKQNNNVSTDIKLLNSDKMIIQMRKDIVNVNKSQIEQNKIKIENVNKINADSMMQDMNEQNEVKFNEIVKQIKYFNDNINKMNSDSIIDMMNEENAQQFVETMKAYKYTNDNIGKMDSNSRVKKMIQQSDEKLNDMMIKFKYINDNINKLDSNSIIEDMQKQSNKKFDEIMKNSKYFNDSINTLDSDSMLKAMNKQDDEKVAEIVKNIKHFNENINRINANLMVDMMNQQNNEKVEEMITKYKYFNDNISKINANSMIDIMNLENDEKCIEMIQKYKYINDNISKIDSNAIFEKMKQELDEKEIEKVYSNDNVATIDSADFINQMMFNASLAFENKLQAAKVYDGSNVTSTLAYNAFRSKNKINFDRYDNYEQYHAQRNDKTKTFCNIKSDLNDCQSTNKIIDVLKAYNLSNNINDDIVELINDFNHIMTYHCYNQYQLAIFSQHICTSLNVNVCVQSECSSLKGNFRNRYECSKDNNKLLSYYNKHENAQEIITCQILDRIHCFIFHSHDIGYNSNDVPDEEMNEKIISLQNRQKQYRPMNKFSTSFDCKELDIMSNNFHNNNVDKSKYDHLKQELTSNSCCTISMNQWDIILEKSKVYIKCSKYLSKIADNNDVDNDNILSYMISVLIYTNFSCLREKFIQTFYISECRKESEEFVNLSCLLTKCVAYFRNEYTFNDQLNFFHNFNVEYVYTNSSLCICAPLSFTTNINIALLDNKTNDSGILMHVQLSNWFDSKFISDFVNENEILKFNVSLAQIYEIYSYKSNQYFGFYFQCLNKFISFFVNYDNNVCFDTDEWELIEAIWDIIRSNTINQHQYDHHTMYIAKLFQRNFDLITKISLNMTHIKNGNNLNTESCVYNSFIDLQNSIDGYIVEVIRTFKNCQTIFFCNYEHPFFKPAFKLSNLFMNNIINTLNSNCVKYSRLNEIMIHKLDDHYPEITNQQSIEKYAGKLNQIGWKISSVVRIRSSESLIFERIEQMTLNNDNLPDLSNQTHIIFICDQSGSMSDNDGGYSQPKLDFIVGANGLNNRLGCLYEAIHKFIECRMQLNCIKDDIYSVVMFDNDSFIAAERVIADCNFIQNYLLQYTPNGGTNFYVGFETANTLVQYNEKTIMVFLTDGEACDNGASTIVADLKMKLKNRFTLNCITLGSSTSETVKIVCKAAKGNAMEVSTGNELGNTFKNIAQTLGSIANKGKLF